MLAPMNFRGFAARQFGYGFPLLAMALLPLGINAQELKTGNKTSKEILSHTARINPQLLLGVIENQLKALRDKEIDKAYKDYTSSDFQKQTSLEDFKELIGKFPQLSNNKLFQFQSFYTEDDIASFGGDLLSMEGDFVRVEYDLVMEDGKWKIYGMQIYTNT